MAERIKIYPWQTDTAGCFYQRLKLPLDALEAAYPDEFEVCWTCEPKAGEGDARSVVLGQRIMGHGTEGDPRWLDYCRNPGILAVIEVDDDILDLDPGNTVPYSIFTPNRLGTMENIYHSNAVIASTGNLAWKIWSGVFEGEGSITAAEGLIYVAPNCVADGSVIEREAPASSGALTIGWAGSMFHQQDFPPSLVEQLAAVRDDHPDVRWLTIGANYLGWGNHIGWGSIENYHAALRHLDIGIAPIARTPFNASKSWIKALDYMAHGVVPVVEHWGQYPELLGYDGRTASTTPGWPYVGLSVDIFDWQTYLDKAIVDLRLGLFDHHAIAERAREFEISRQVHRWAEVFRKAVS